MDFHVVVVTVLMVLVFLLIVALIPTRTVLSGTIVPYAGTEVPHGYLACDGSSVLIKKYPRLYNIIGLTYSDSPASGYFTLPDLRGRAVFGADVDEFTQAVSGGSTHQTLITANLASHTHSITDPGHGHTFTSINDDFNSSSSNNTNIKPSMARCDGTEAVSWTGSANPVGGSQATGITATNSAGSGTPFSILNPYLAVPYIIKT